MFRSKADEERKQKSFKENLTKAMRTPDETERKKAVFEGISGYLAEQGLKIDVAQLEKFAATAPQLSEMQAEFIKSFRESTPEQILEMIGRKYGKLEEYNPLKADYDAAVDEANKHLVDAYQKLAEKKNRLIEDFGEDADISDLEDKQAMIAKEGMELDAHGLPDHAYNKVKEEHEQLLQAFEQDISDYNALIGVGMTYIMRGVSDIEAKEQERVSHVTAGTTELVIGASLMLGSVLIIPTALFIPSVASVIFGAAAISTPILIATGFVGIALQEIGGKNLDQSHREEYSIDHTIESARRNAEDAVGKSKKIVDSLESMRTAERGM